MPVRNDAAHALIREHLLANPDTPNHTAAKYLYANYAEHWYTMDACRTMIRADRGAKGKKTNPVPELVRPHGTAHDRAPIPDGLLHFPDTTPFRPATGKALILADLHPPFHDRGAVEAALEYGEKVGCDRVIINGDGTDFPGISRFDRDLRRFEGTFKEEVRLIREFWQAIVANAPWAKSWHWRMGNHDDRFELYLMAKAPEIFPVLYEEGVSFKTILHADKLGIEIIPEGRDLYLGHLLVTHGHHERMSGGGWPAKKLWTKVHTTAICGHIHKIGSFMVTDKRGTDHQTWTMGCLCQKHWDYARFAGYAWGFAVCEYDQDTNDFALENLKIMDDYRVRGA